MVWFKHFIFCVLKFQITHEKHVCYYIFFCALNLDIYNLQNEY
jgi:hypothetical protein